MITPSVSTRRLIAFSYYSNVAPACRFIVVVSVHGRSVVSVLRNCFIEYSTTLYSSSDLYLFDWLGSAWLVRTGSVFSSYICKEVFLVWFFWIFWRWNLVEKFEVKSWFVLFNCKYGLSSLSIFIVQVTYQAFDFNKFLLDFREIKQKTPPKKLPKNSTKNNSHYIM